MDAPKPHRRQPSNDDRRRVAIPRRTTMGPLDAPVDDPLAEAPAPEPVAAAVTSPTTASPVPPSTITSPLSPTLSIGLEDLPPKELSFLLEPSIYHPLPPQTTPQPFLASPNTPSLNSPLGELLSRGHYRAAAVQCARTLTTTALGDSTNVSNILSLFHIRLACLSLLGYHDLAAQESKAFGDLSSAFYRHPLTGAHIVPWPLRVLCVRLSALGYGEWRKGIMGFYELAREAREEAVQAKTEADKAQWAARLRELGVRVANLLIEMSDLDGATDHLSTLGNNLPSDGEEAQKIRFMEAMVWLRIGDVAAAKRCLPSSETEEEQATTLNALIKMADNDYDGAVAIWRSLLEKPGSTANPMISQNLAVCLLYIGCLEEARSLLESLVDAGYSFHTLTFNLCTVFELCTERSRERKMKLAETLAAQAPSPGGWEKVAGDFKL